MVYKEYSSAELHWQFFLDKFLLDKLFMHITDEKR